MPKKKKSKFARVFQFKITLLETKPPVWRCIQVPETYSFWELHVAIQDAMGWLDSHLHGFDIKDPRDREITNIGLPTEDILDTVRETLPGWEEKIADYFNIENDFGDSWEHKIKLEKILPREKEIDYPRCIKGKRACPPEDCGGPWGYKDFLKILKDPKHEEHDEMLEWVGGEFDPEHFDKKEVVFNDPEERRKMAISFIQ